MHIQAKTLDDILHKTLPKLIRSKNRPVPSKGSTREIFGVLLELDNPRARLSQTETKGVFFSCLGEFLWYVSGSNKLNFIQHYISNYHEFSDDKVILNGAYGPRLFEPAGNSQYDTIKNRLSRSDTRNAVIQILDRSDISKKTKDVPCTCTMQFVVRDSLLHMMTSMRSNDVFVGLPHDIFAFSMIQEILARDLGYGLGSYKHSVGSLHLYESDLDKAKRYLDEGWQDSEAGSMPPMPKGDPWPALRGLLAAEEKIRSGSSVDLETLGLNGYWADLARLLQVYAISKKDFRGNERNRLRDFAEVKSKMTSTFYDYHIRKREKNIKPAPSQIELGV